MSNTEYRRSKKTDRIRHGSCNGLVTRAEPAKSAKGTEWHESQSRGHTFGLSEQLSCHSSGLTATWPATATPNTIAAPRRNRVNHRRTANALLGPSIPARVRRCVVVWLSFAGWRRVVAGRLLKTRRLRLGPAGAWGYPLSLRGRSAICKTRRRLENGQRGNRHSTERRDSSAVSRAGYFASVSVA